MVSSPTFISYLPLTFFLENQKVSDQGTPLVEEGLYVSLTIDAKAAPDVSAPEK